MSFSDDAVKAKLSTLNESQDSIVSVASWIMFYRRHADRAAQLWLEKLKDSNTSKKLNLIYLANEVMQQAKARKKEDFLLAFMPLVSEATFSAYKGATQEVQGKLRRVVEVWRQRGILDSAIQDATESRIDQLDKNKASRPGGGRLGGSLFGSSSVPAELQSVTQHHSTLSRLETTARPLVTKANTEYAEQTNPDAFVPSPPVQAGRISSLVKSLASAESAVNDSIKARKELIAGLERVLESHRGKLTEDETTQADLSTRKSAMEVKRKEVEDVIFRRVSAEDAAAGTPDGEATPANGVNGGTAGSGSPEIEGFTPPPPDVEQFTPTASPKLEPQQEPQPGEDRLENDTYAADLIQEVEPDRDEPTPAFEPPPALENNTSSGFTDPVAPGMDLMSTLSALQNATRPSPDAGTLDPRKRRKMSHKSSDMDDQLFASGNGIGLDEDIAAQLGAQ